MIHYKNKEEIELIRESALIVSRTLGILAEIIQPGISPKTLDKKAEEYIRDQGALPGFLGLYDFPAPYVFQSMNKSYMVFPATNN